MPILAIPRSLRGLKRFVASPQEGLGPRASLKRAVLLGQKLQKTWVASALCFLGKFKGVGFGLKGIHASLGFRVFKQERMGVAGFDNLGRNSRPCARAAKCACPWTLSRRQGFRV